MRWGAVILWLAGLGFLGVGVAALFDPVALMRPLGFGLERADAQVEIRAFYGGACSALGAVLCFCARDAVWQRPGLMLGASVYGATGTVRALAMVLSGTTSAALGLILAVELLLAAACALAARQHKVRPGRIAAGG